MLAEEELDIELDEDNQETSEEHQNLLVSQQSIPECIFADNDIEETESPPTIQMETVQVTQTNIIVEKLQLDQIDEPEDDEGFSNAYTDTLVDIGRIKEKIEKQIVDTIDFLVDETVKTEDRLNLSQDSKYNKKKSKTDINFN